MMPPLEITVRNTPNTEALEMKIRKKAEKLAGFYNHVEFIKVVVDVEQKHKHQGKLYCTRIEVGVPGKHLMSNHKYDENVYVTVRDSFAAIQRQLEDYARKQRGHMKVHQEMMRGKVTRLFNDYGFIEAIDGQEYYFSSSSLSNSDFDDLDIGSAVSFLETVGGDGLQAMHVKPLHTVS